MPKKIKKIKKKVSFGNNEGINFNCELQEFKENSEKEGQFTGILVNMQGNTAAKGVYRFQKGSMKSNDGKKLLLMYNHYGELMPIGTLTGKETEKGFEVIGQFHLTKDANGNYLNPEAAKLYSFMKEMHASFEMSVGGVIEEYKEKSEGNNYFIDIYNFNAHEGSLTPKGAVKGSRVTRVFNRENGGIGQMDKEQLKLLMAELLANFKTELLEAGTSKEIKELPEKFNEISIKFEEIKTELNGEFKAEIEKQMNEFNEIIKGLKADFKPTRKEVTAAEQFSAMIQAVEKTGKSADIVFTEETEVSFADPASTSNTAAAVKTQYVNTILERLTDINPVLTDITFIPITDGSLTIPREVAGLPETGWVGEEENRKETTTSKLENLNIAIHQLYAMPKITNKLLATNFVGYANFLLKRVEYALSLRLADALFSGTGANMPTGILKDTSVKKKVEFDTTDDTTFVDSIITAYYSMKEAIAKQAKWYFSPETWARIAKLKNSQKDFYLTDLDTGTTRTLMSRPVILVDSENAELKGIDTATAGTDIVGVFADLSTAVMGIQNNAMTMRLEDKVTSKGYTKYYMEKGVGFGVQLPENIIKIVKKA
ncbi:phage major capsid protein [Fusobacterium nucleatum]|uniref:phage major capsid protein n=1 Tax=Fusobacterium nucleatum TaxID=851 RepID=UPI0030CAFC6B